MVVPGTDPTERLGVFAVGVRAEQAGWAFRELPRPDRGVDAHIEARTDGRPDGRLLALQIKSGESQFRQLVPGEWRFYIDSAHSAYWRSYAMARRVAPDCRKPAKGLAPERAWAPQ
jgi:hypothetical protein